MRRSSLGAAQCRLQLAKLAHGRLGAGAKVHDDADVLARVGALVVEIVEPWVVIAATNCMLHLHFSTTRAQRDSTYITPGGAFRSGHPFNAWRFHAVAATPRTVGGSGGKACFWLLTVRSSDDEGAMSIGVGAVAGNATAPRQVAFHCDQSAVGWFSTGDRFVSREYLLHRGKILHGSNIHSPI